MSSPGPTISSHDFCCWSSLMQNGYLYLEAHALKAWAPGLHSWKMGPCERSATEYVPLQWEIELLDLSPEKGFSKHEVSCAFLPLRAGLLQAQSRRFHYQNLQVFSHFQTQHKMIRNLEVSLKKRGQRTARLHLKPGYTLDGGRVY